MITHVRRCVVGISLTIENSGTYSYRCDGHHIERDHSVLARSFPRPIALCWKPIKRRDDRRACNVGGTLTPSPSGVLSFVRFILRQAMLSGPRHCPFRHPSAWTCWELDHWSGVQAHEGNPRQLLARSQWADCSVPCSQRRLALSSCPVQAHFARMPRRRSKEMRRQQAMPIASSW